MRPSTTGNGLPQWAHVVDVKRSVMACSIGAPKPSAHVDQEQHAGIPLRPMCRPSRKCVLDANAYLRDSRHIPTTTPSLKVPINDRAKVARDIGI
jgi:hypothetical protein